MFIYSKKEAIGSRLFFSTRFFGRRAVYWGDKQPRYEKSFVGGVRIFILTKYIGGQIKNLTFFGEKILLKNKRKSDNKIVQEYQNGCLKF